MKWWGRKSAARRSYNAAWEDFRARGRIARSLPQELTSAADLEAVRAAVTTCPSQPALTLFLAGPEVVGPNVPLPALEGRSPSDVLLHRTLLLLETLLDSLGRTRAYGGFWNAPSSANTSIVLWVEHGDSRLCAIPQLQLGASDISVSLSHAVLWRQPWMTEHASDDFGWADLATNYQSHFGEGGTYWEALASWQKGERMWQHTRYGVEFTRDRGSPLLMSPFFQSFYNFRIGEPPFSGGCPAGHDLQRLQMALARASQQWAMSASGPSTSGRPFTPRPGFIRQRED